MKAGALGVEGAIDTQRRLAGYVRAGRVHPALILGGPDRLLKLRVVKGLAKALFCRGNAENRPNAFCGECSTCRRIEKDIHPDVVFFLEEEEETLKIDAIRELCHQMEIGSIEDGPKVCIIDECHRMTTASANAFLKTLEEPGPQRFFWLLTTQPGALLPTILSRCLQFTFLPETARPAHGTAASTDTHRKLLVEALKHKNPAPLVSALDEKEKCLDFVRFLQTELRGAAVGPFAGEKPSPVFAGLPAPLLLQKFNEALQLEGRLRSNANFGLLLESYLRREILAGS